MEIVPPYLGSYGYIYKKHEKTQEIYIYQQFTLKYCMFDRVWQDGIIHKMKK